MQRLRRVEQSPAPRARHSEGGPAMVQQFDNVLSLCDDLLAERAAAR
jgi:hypothetical protein